jgi:RND family efflux transporter MFP subunit
MIKATYYKALLFIVLVLAVSCSGNKHQTVETAMSEELPDSIVELRADQVKMAEIQLGNFETRSMGKILKVNGKVTVAPQNSATVCIPFGGFIKSTSMIPGNPVEKGQLLAIVSNQEFIDIQRGYLEAKNKLSFAEADFKRHNVLYQNDVYSEQNLQQVTVEYKNLKAELKSLEQKLVMIGLDPEKLTEDNISSEVNLVSPLKGYLKTVNINVGKFVSTTDVLFEIVNTDKLMLELVLFEKDADRVSAGQRLTFFINDESETHEAVVYQTGKAVNDDKTIKVFAVVTSYCRNVLPGMYVNAFIEESKDTVTVLPSEAIVSFNDKDYIFVYGKDKEEAGKPFTEYKMVEVTKGIVSAGYTEVRLPNWFGKVGARVVIKGAYNLLSAKKNAGEMAC